MEQIFQSDKRNDCHQKWPTNVSGYEGKQIRKAETSEILLIKK